MKRRKTKNKKFFIKRRKNEYTAIEPIFAVILFTNNKIDENRQCEWRKAEKNALSIFIQKNGKNAKEYWHTGLAFFLYLSYNGIR